MLGPLLSAVLALVAPTFGHAMLLTQGPTRSVEGTQQSSSIDVSGAKYYALLIGTDHYDSYSPLHNAIGDVTNIGNELRDMYGFNVKLLTDPSKTDIFNCFEEYKKINFGPADELLVYVAGHGAFDSDLLKTGLLALKASKPGDLTKDSFFLFSALRDMLDGLPVKHVLLVLDVCFGADFSQEAAKLQDPTRGLDSADKATEEEFLGRKMKSITRQFIASGPVEVPDGAPGKGSPFANGVLVQLRKYEKLLTLEELFSGVEMLKSLPVHGTWGDDQPGSVFVFRLKAKP
ncbi:MAG TPA: caspase family protein [Fimbriimonadaceae bacterium]